MNELEKSKSEIITHKNTQLMTIMKDMVNESRIDTDKNKIWKLRKVIQTINTQHRKGLESIKQIHTAIQIKILLKVYEAKTSNVKKDLSDLKDRTEVSDHQMKDLIKRSRDHENTIQQLLDDAKIITSD